MSCTKLMTSSVPDVGAELGGHRCPAEQAGEHRIGTEHVNTQRDAARTGQLAERADERRAVAGELGDDPGIVRRGARPRSLEEQIGHRVGAAVDEVELGRPVHDVLAVEGQLPVFPPAHKPDRFCGVEVLEQREMLGGDRCYADAGGGGLQARRGGRRDGELLALSLPDGCPHADRGPGHRRSA